MIINIMKKLFLADNLQDINNNGIKIIDLDKVLDHDKSNSLDRIEMYKNIVNLNNHASYVFLKTIYIYEYYYEFLLLFGIQSPIKYIEASYEWFLKYYELFTYKINWSDHNNTKEKEKQRFINFKHDVEDKSFITTLIEKFKYSEIDIEDYKLLPAEFFANYIMNPIDYHKVSDIYTIGYQKFSAFRRYLVIEVLKDIRLFLYNKFPSDKKYDESKYPVLVKLNNTNMQLNEYLKDPDNLKEVISFLKSDIFNTKYPKEYNLYLLDCPMSKFITNPKNTFGYSGINTFKYNKLLADAVIKNKLIFKRSKESIWKRYM